MTVTEFTAQLKERISPQEAEQLRNGTDGLCISAFNRDVCLRLLDAEIPRGTVDRDSADRACPKSPKNTADSDSAAIDPADVAALEADLSAYLNEYMEDRPEGHKWIILACLYLTFAERLPMHPQSAAKWVEKDGRYYCPSMAPESITCKYCMCESIELQDAALQGAEQSCQRSSTAGK